ncbi:hypothetical protein MRX96_047133 [Rhipicephalus microplus]
MQPHSAIFSDPQEADLPVGPSSATPCEPQRVVVSVPPRMLISVPSTLPRAADLHLPKDIAVHPCDDLYSTPLPAGFPMTFAPVRERGGFPSLFSECRNADQDATSEEQLATLAVPLLSPPLPPSCGTPRGGHSIQ